MRDFLTGLGLMLAIEGVIYALFAGGMQAMMREMEKMPPQTLRLLGVGSLALGVFVVWLARG
jgi:uncharacterized protein YjeT (DUF2065 family)